MHSSLDSLGQKLRHLSAPSRKTFFKMAEKSTATSRPSRTTRRGVLDCRSLDKIQSIIIKDFEKSKKKSERHRYFKCRVVSKPRNINGVPLVKVRYEGWGREYDEWRPISELTGRANECETDEERQDDIVTLELDRIRVRIQESLTGLRRCDTLVTIKEPVSEKTWIIISGASRVKKAFKKRSTLHSPIKIRFDKLFGNGWSRRYFNCKGDYSEVILRTMQLYLVKRKALRCYERKSNGIFVPKAIERGLYVVINFIRKDGNSL